MAQVQRVRALRAFRHRGEDVGIGSVIDLATPDAWELRNGNKAEFVVPDTKVQMLSPKPKEKKPSVEDQQRQILDLQRQQIAALTGVAKSLAQLVEKLSAKEKGNAN